MKRLDAKRRVAFFGLVVLLAVSGGWVRAQQSAPPGAPPPAAAAPSAPAPQNPQPPLVPPGQATLRVTTGYVKLVVTVLDHHRNFITDLDKTDFKVLEDGQPQTIRFFAGQTDLPLRIALLLDTSNSIRQRLQFEKDAAIDFLGKVVRRNKDLAFLMTFDNEPQFIQDYTDNFALLQNAIQDQRAGGGTALNDAICMASEKLSHSPMPKGEDSDVRRVIVVFTDGDDNSSGRALSDAIDASIRSEAAIYGISTNTDWLAIDTPGKPSKYHMEPKDKVLQQFADQTGGHAFFPYGVDDLAQSFDQIGTELRSQYFIAYAPAIPPSDGRYRRVDVQTSRKGLTVRTRKGYYAIAQPAGAGPAR